MRKLDFIVFGLARSGTTALTNLIRANRRLYCGAEFFTPRQDHSRIDVPKAFFDEEARLERDGKVPQNIRVSMDILHRRDPAEIVLYGNKWPLYSHFFDRVMSELDHPKAILAYRDYRACARSYERRSQDPNDGWPAGRRSIFAGLELIHILKMLAQSTHKNTLIVPQKLLANNPEKTLEQVTEYLTPGQPVALDKDVAGLLERSLASGRQRKPKPLTPSEQPVFRKLDNAGVNDLFPSDRCVQLKEIQAALREAVAKLPEDHISFGKRLALEHGDTTVLEYFEIWKAIAQEPANPD